MSNFFRSVVDRLDELAVSPLRLILSLSVAVTEMSIITEPQ